MDIYYPRSREHVLPLISAIYRPNRALQKVRAAGQLRVLSVYVMYFYYSVSSTALARVGSKVSCTAGTERAFRT